MTHFSVLGETFHHRLTPKENYFRYKYWGLLLNLKDLDNIPSLISRNRVLSIFHVNDDDFLYGLKKHPLEQLEIFFKIKNIKAPVETVYVFFTPRFLGYSFNPVKYYFGYSANKLRWFLAEINNTFYEKHCYFKDLEDYSSFYFRWDKTFFVSPFFPVEGFYKVHLKDPLLKSEISVKFLLFDREKRIIFKAGHLGKLKPLTALDPFAVSIRSPLLVWHTIPKIYYQALKLFVKRMGLQKKPNPISADTIVAKPYSLVESFCMTKVLKILSSLPNGSLRLINPDNSEHFFSGKNKGFDAQIKINNFKIFRKVCFGGSIGFGDSYVDGDFESSDLSSLIGYFLSNWSYLKGLEKGFFSFFFWLSHLLNANTLKKSPKNISFHYDLPVDFFKAFLDETLTYSCAFFTSDTSLYEAQIKKIDSALEELEVKSSEHLLEIGSGFGSLALRAAEKIGCRVTTITLSKNQFDYLNELIAKKGLSKLVTVKFQDYRTLSDQYDKIVSIEMIEAVGKRFLPTYFKVIDSCLRPGGVAVLQIITFPDQFTDSYTKRADWIQLRVFPGSYLPSLKEITQVLADYTKLVIDLLYDKSDSYAKTLRVWRQNLEKNSLAVLKDFGNKLFRTWQFYLASCEAEFQTKWLRLLRVRLCRPNEIFFV